MAEKKNPIGIDYSWLDGMLESELARIAEALEQGGKASASDFVRLVEFHRETFGVPEPPRREVIWVDNIDEIRNPPRS